LISEIEIEPGEVNKVYSKKETWELEKLWMSTFCKDKQGANTKSYKWHIFSYDKYPSISGEKAKLIYLEQKAPEYIVLPNDGELAIETNELPQKCDLSDYYVFPKNLAWTMAFTHEEGWYGPYFAKHIEYDLLVEKNLRQIQKNKEMKMAKDNGWA